MDTKIKLYSNNENYKLYHGNMLDMLNVIKPNSVDSIVTDPPYELNFMGKDWDNSGIAFNKNTWIKCYSILKKGGYLLAFGGSRTYHRIACAIEDAGFEIRDTIMWIYGSGFPKSMNLGLAIDKKNGVESVKVGTRKEHDIRSNNHANNDVSTKTFERDIKVACNEWSGWGTALKPSFEPIIVARKPFKGSLVDNIIKNGVGGLNIDECRIETKDNLNGGGYNKKGTSKKKKDNATSFYTPVMNKDFIQPTGRYPANTILTYDDTDYDEVCGNFPNTNNGSASRYFYCAKASKKDRDEGLEKDGDRKNTTPKKNNHPTVKPTNLMQYLVRLVTPNGGVILDPFNGSGSTGKAVMYENKEHDKEYKYIGIELTEEYLPIAKARIEHVNNEQKKKEQLTIFDFMR